MERRRFFTSATVCSIWQRTLVALSTIILLGLFSGITRLQAHEGPEHEIEELTERIAKHGESADLLLQRATEFRVLGKHAEAARDLEHALRIEAHLVGAQRELSRTYFALGKTNEALKIANAGLRTAAAGPDRASLLVVRAEILEARKLHGKALEDLHRALREYPGNVDWYCARSQLQAGLKLTKERIHGLEEGLEATGSGVLQTEWVEALIADGQHARALEKIEPELKASRWKSSWLIRRAQVRFALGKPAEARSDLEAALAELMRRINAAAPDPSLLADRGMARELLGDEDEARKDYELAQSKGFTEDWLRERIRILKGADVEDEN